MVSTDGDAELMLAFGRGDGAAFDALFGRWASPLLRYLERMVRDAATAEELLQETFLRVHRARERYQPTARFSTWLYRIATNLALNELRRPRRTHVHASTDDDESPLPELAATSVAMDELVDARRLAAQVDELMAGLPKRQRVALWLVAGEGFSYAEVAEVLGAGEASVKALVHRARSSVVSRLGAARKGDVAVVAIGRTR